MKIGVTSQNFRTITGHAGKARRFFVYQLDENQQLKELERIDLPKEMSLHETGSASHPIDELDVLITAGCGSGFERKMAERNIRLVKTSETDPLIAVNAVVEELISTHV
ncbi:NifB/NifX family molybdenum-iron cluster-binding protein [uncultured Cocleimonas sp.]|uniref:NifB/NifX family molybdenum-iron cluster-binding protein n=1 Tax=uncultured Cocleimonas sp. TaxID=1051587 RepID=UPI0026284885|nr:NifB/NifX family molybdenum-iron cluster-binding protein [uncultured Cocleimonas sp.]